MQALFQQEGFKDFVNEIKYVYDNLDNALHAIGCQNREFFSGACFGTQQILNLEEILEDELGNIEKKEKFKVL